MSRLLPVLIAVALMVYCIVEVAQAPHYAVRRAPKWLWCVVIVVLPIIGPICWLLLGRPSGATGSGDGSTQRYPDDEPDFMRRL